MSDFIDKVNQIVDEDTERKTLTNFLRNKHGIHSQKHIDFYIEFMKCGIAYKAYQKVFAPNMNRGTAAVAANRLFNKHKVNFLDFLIYAGHGPDSIVEALTALKDKDPDAYLKHLAKYGQYEVDKVEHSTKDNLPIQINIISQICNK